MVTRFFVPVSATERWYDYLWYIPTTLNSLRGVGIFFIIVLTPEKRKELYISYRRYKTRLLTKPHSSSSRRNGNKTSFSVDFHAKKYSFNDDRRRNMSVTTVISTLSSSFNLGTKSEDEFGNNLKKSSVASYLSTKIDTIRKKSSINNGVRSAATDDGLHKLSLNNNIKPKRKLGMIWSVSEMDRKLSIASSTGSFLEELEMKEDSFRRKLSSIPPTLSLPKLQEEESIFEDSDPRHKYIKEDSQDQENSIFLEKINESPKISFSVGTLQYVLSHCFLQCKCLHETIYFSHVKIDV